MQENLNTPPAATSRIKRFFLDMLSGFGIGVAFIIPGFSGGSIAAILGIYERLVGAIAGIFRDFKRSFATLLPIFIGVAVGALSLLYPLAFALSAFPIPTVLLFVGLALGGITSITGELKGRIRPTNIAALLIPLAVAFSLIFIPGLADKDLLSSGPFDYLLLFLVGALCSSALVVPGISGSMILLILGYYNPIVSIITVNFLGGEERLAAFFILLTVGMGIIVGFIAISMLMKKLFDISRRGVYFAILGFIIGSVPSAFISVGVDAGYATSGLPADPVYWIASVLLLALGAAISLSITLAARRRRTPKDSLPTENTAAD